MHHLQYPRCESLNRWLSFDAHLQDGAGSMSLLFLPIKKANTSIMTICNQCPLWLPRMQDQKLFTLRSRSFPGWGRECLSTCFDPKGGRYIQKEQCRTIIISLRLIVGYPNATINRTTWNAKRAIEPDEPSHHGETRGLAGKGPGLDHQGAAGWVFGRFWTWPEPFFRSKPGQLAGYPDALLTLEMAIPALESKYI